MIECPYDDEVAVIEINGFRYEENMVDGYHYERRSAYGLLHFYRGSTFLGGCDSSLLRFIGAKCFKPSSKKRVEFEAEVHPSNFTAKHPAGIVDHVDLEPLIGKKVKVTVEEL